MEQTARDNLVNSDLMNGCNLIVHVVLEDLKDFVILLKTIGKRNSEDCVLEPAGADSFMILSKVSLLTFIGDSVDDKLKLLGIFISNLGSCFENLSISLVVSD